MCLDGYDCYFEQKKGRQERKESEANGGGCGNDDDDNNDQFAFPSCNVFHVIFHRLTRNGKTFRGYLARLHCTLYDIQTK